MPTTCPRAALLLSALAALSGCADSLSAPLAGAGGAEARQLGQTVLFVGADPVTLETDLYLARALASEGDMPPGLLEAEGFELEALGIAARGRDAGLFPDGALLFSDALPYAVPDREGRRVGLVATPPLSPDLSGQPGAGRAGVLDLETGLLEVTGDMPGLQTLQFSSNGGFLFLSTVGVDGQPGPFSLLASDALDGEPIPQDAIEGLPPGASAQLAERVRDSDDFLVLARQEGGDGAVYRIDPLASRATALLADGSGAVDSPALSPSGRYLAATQSAPNDPVRSLVVFDLDDGSATALSDPASADCSWPVWAPDTGNGDRLAYVCQRLTTNRPDIALWPADESASGDGYLTDRAQPAIVGGSMDGQVVRSRPLWDPLGEFLIFGLSPAADVEGDLTLLELPLGSSVFPIYSAPQGSVGWAHFSALAASRELLVWDRGTTGLQASSGQHPIQVVATDSPTPSARGVDLGADLLVSYPLFLGQNTMLYP